LVSEILAEMRKQDIADIPVIVGGIIPPEDAEAMEAEGIAQVFTPKDFDLAQIMNAIADLVGERHREPVTA
jgi:(2R)-ethylmalonyl-CoA mutase